MSAAAWIALAGVTITLLLNIVTLAIGYGVLRGTVSAIAGRVKALEEEIGAITELKVSIATVAAKQDAMFEQLRDLAASVRWMRDPAPTSQRRKTGE